MNHSINQALENRRTYYSINNLSPISDQQIQQIVTHAILHTPSAFNSQSSRIVVLFNENHKKLWQIVIDSLRATVPQDKFEPTEQRIASFAAGYATILYFEDQAVVENLQKKYPLYANNFPVWSNQVAGMHQLAVWTMLEDAGLGASLQHYNPLIDNQVQKEWNIPQSWHLVAQMPFGTPTAPPNAKTYLPVDDRLLIFR